MFRFAEYTKGKTGYKELLNDFGSMVAVLTCSFLLAMAVLERQFIQTNYLWGTALISFIIFGVLGGLARSFGLNQWKLIKPKMSIVVENVVNATMSIIMSAVMVAAAIMGGFVVFTEMLRVLA